MEKQENELVEIHIDLGAARKGQVTESWLGMMGGGIKAIMNRMFTGSGPPVRISGSRGEVNAFQKAIGSEKKYIETAAKYGLDDPRTYKNKFALRQNINKFERATGITWPFKG